MSRADIIAAIENLSTFELDRLLESSAFWGALERGGTLLERADIYEICDELQDRGLTPYMIERLRELIEDEEAIERPVAATASGASP